MVCKQQRRRPACAFAQSDQHPCYLLNGKYHIYTCFKGNQTLYHVTVKAGSYSKATSVAKLRSTTYSSSIFRFIFESQRTFTRHRCARSPSNGLFTLGAKCNECKNAYHHCPCWGWNPGPLGQNQSLYQVTVKVGSYSEAVQVLINYSLPHSYSSEKNEKSVYAIKLCFI